MMTPEQRPSTLWPIPMTIDDEHERLDRALGELMREDRWVRDFVKRLNYTGDDTVRRQ